MSISSQPVTVTMSDGVDVFVNRWLPADDATPRAIVQIAHGMAEHSDRYARLAERLVAEGYVVYANDHRGHGRTASDERDRGYFADRDGFNCAVRDLHVVTQRARDDFPGLPVYLLGHSMGSFLSRAYAARWGSELAGLVLIGTAGDPGLLGRIGRLVARAEARLRGRRHRSTLLTKLTFGAYNKQFKPARTEFDWLSRDEAEVDAYVADPRCGEVFTSAFYVDLLGGLRAINSDEVVAATPNELPIYLTAGQRDPVGDNGAGVGAVAAQYRRLGSTDVTLQLWPEARHEILNETNRDEVIDQLVHWLARH